MPAFAFAEKKLGEAGLEGKNLTAPAKLYLALTENAINRTYTGTEVADATKGAELSYPGYGRVEVKMETATWTFTAATNTTPAKWVNASAIPLKIPSTTGGKTKATYFALLDATTAGNGWYYGTLALPLILTSSMTSVKIDPGQLEVSYE